MKWAIDVSRYDAVMPNGTTYAPVDWVKAKEVGGLSLAIIKSSEGVGYRDEAFNIQAQAAKDAGLPRAAYHFFRSNRNAIHQAANMYSFLQAANWGTGDFVILDYETKDGLAPHDSLMAAGSFLYEMDKRGITPMIYTYPAFWKSIGGESAGWAKKYPLCLAQWPKDYWVLQFPITIFDAPKLAAIKADIESGRLKPMALKPWDSPAIWQFTSRADSKAIPGHPAVKKVVDYNAVFMDLPGVSQPQYVNCPTCNGMGKVPSK